MLFSLHPEKCLELLVGQVFLLLGKGLVTPANRPTVSPTVPGREMGRPTRPYRLVHQIGKERVLGLLLNTRLESQVGLLSLLLGSSTPIGHVVQKTTFLPKLRLFESTVYEHAAPVAGKVRQLGRRVRHLDFLATP